MTGFKKPKSQILGFDVSGEVESVGKKVAKFKKGDLIYGALKSAGANAEYVCIPEENAAMKPSNLSHEEAAAVPDTACTALHGLREKITIQNGQSILIYGASGGVGSFAVQIARLFTSEITAVCSTDKVANAESFGAKRVIDYTKEDFTSGGQTYDYIFDAVGRKKITYDQCKDLLNKNGVFVTVDLESVIFKNMLNNKVRSYLAPITTEKLDFLREHIEAGRIKPIVDKVFPLSETAEAHKLYENGHLNRKLVIKVQD
ncbi:NAD(P)-dependent alcohol dehydrogenase [bacterium]|nr:NAD(P)-dependent alcohol dehydrogenase [bacterium]